MPDHKLVMIFRSKSGNACVITHFVSSFLVTQSVADTGTSAHSDIHPTCLSSTLLIRYQLRMETYHVIFTQVQAC